VKNTKPLPPYVAFCDPRRPDYKCVMRLKENGEYWRDAGNWKMKAKWKGKNLIVVADYAEIKHLTGKLLRPATKKEWLEDNHGYV